ncbi:MAG: cbb3-type cytochrome oxidase assembly protein CcoS [Planctomycetota bacterium]
MSVVFIVLPLGLLLAAFAVAAFIWATRAGQFDDLETPAMRAVHDEDD